MWGECTTRQSLTIEEDGEGTRKERLFATIVESLVISLLMHGSEEQIHYLQEALQEESLESYMDSESESEVDTANVEIT